MQVKKCSNFLRANLLAHTICVLRNATITFFLQSGSRCRQEGTLLSSELVRTPYQPKTDCEPRWVFYSLRLEATRRLACSRLSDSGEDAKVKGTRKNGGAKTEEKEGPSFLPF